MRCFDLISKPLGKFIKIYPMIAALLLFSIDVNAECDLDKTPLARGDSCSGYMQEDKALNFAYKILSKKVGKSNLSSLKKTQLQWIKWRDERCDMAQEESGCTGLASNSSCMGVAHDECILDLTLQRTNELHQFIKNPQDAAKRNFDFSRKNKYLDDE